jgi:hypothetical protein
MPPQPTPYVVVDTPSSFNKEEMLHFAVPLVDGKGKDVVVVSGYVHYQSNWSLDNGATGVLVGSDDHDWKQNHYELRFFVGPSWRKLHDVSPIAFINEVMCGDIKDADALGVETCTWEWVEGPDNPKHQIRLIVKCHIAGGPEAVIQSVGYHLTARGDVMPTNFGELN